VPLLAHLLVFLDCRSHSGILEVASATLINPREAAASRRLLEKLSDSLVEAAGLSRQAAYLEHFAKEELVADDLCDTRAQHVRVLQAVRCSPSLQEQSLKRQTLRTIVVGLSVVGIIVALNSPAG